MNSPEKPKSVRLESTLRGLARVSLILALGHFLCVPLLHFLPTQTPGVSVYKVTVFLSGVLFSLVAFLFRFRQIQNFLPYSCLGLLFFQTAYFAYQQQEIFHPFTMAFALLTALATPVLGRYRSYAAAVLSSAVLIYFYFTFPKSSDSLILSFSLLETVILCSAFLSETLWAQVLEREESLEKALEEIDKKNREMETWVQRLGAVGNQISSGDLSAVLPSAPPDKVFKELTASMEQMQTKLNHYFSNLLLKDRLSSLGVLASGIAHELNTPLTTLQFALHSDTHLPSETRAMLQGEVERMGRITRDLLSFARPHPEEVFNLNEVIKKMEPLLRTRGAKKVPIEFDLTEEPILIKGVSNQIQQILFNLVNNAIDATEKVEGPVIEIKTKKRPDGVATLLVTDNGSGISQENLQKILDPFFTTKSPGKGTGLGLFVVHQIIQKHDGVITIDSEEGKGTTVRVLFLSQQNQEKAA